MADYRSYADQQLLTLLKKGDERAFAEIYERFWGVLLRYAQRMLHDEEECRDVLQNTFVKLWEKSPKLSPDTQLSAYLYTLVRNQVLNVIAKDKLKADHLTDLTSYMDNAVPEADQLARTHQLHQLIEEEVGSMPEKMRQVFELSRNQQLSHKEIAVKMNISVFTVKNHITNALKRIRLHLGL
ncbi:RNA polymerase sigma-70 factor, ECF subfamily [bacterium A37T11]|nr:RNA polymerase sigma-70 factor, ECF subfamily [bacterium A37T11]